jgi:heme O synthase-like polyprenyltransferase
MLPVVAGTETKRQILIYTVLLVPISILPWALGFAGALYGATAGMFGVTIRLRRIVSPGWRRPSLIEWQA